MYRFAFFCLLLFSSPRVSEAVLDRNCTTMDTAGKYTTNAVNCDNIYSDTACALIYGAGVAVGGTVERPLMCFMSNGERSAEMKYIAISTCPKTCGYCCQTEPYDCQNSLYPRVNCETITARQCKDPQWKEIITEDCPNSCGFCAEGGCSDKAVDCMNDLSICVNLGLQSFVKEYCKKTCGFCRPSATTPSPPDYQGTTSECEDKHTNCASWSYKGMCESPFYSYEYKFNRCAATCLLC